MFLQMGLALVQVAAERPASTQGSQGPTTVLSTLMTRSLEAGSRAVSAGMLRSAAPRLETFTGGGGSLPRFFEDLAALAAACLASAISLSLAMSLICSSASACL